VTWRAADRTPLRGAGWAISVASFQRPDSSCLARESVSDEGGPKAVFIILVHAVWTRFTVTRRSFRRSYLIVARICRRYGRPAWHSRFLQCSRTSGSLMRITCTAVSVLKVGLILRTSRACAFAFSIIPNST